MSLSLPPNPRRAMVRSFWLVLSAGVGVIAAIVLTVLRAPVPWLLALLLAGIVGSVVIWQDRLVRGLYLGWNERLVLPFAALARAVLIRILFYAVFVTAGRRGLQKAGVIAQGSVWNPRVTLDPARYAALSVQGRGGRVPFQWRDEYMAWASDTGNRWALSLLPFLLMLRFCSVPQERAAESHIYTLF